MFHNCEGQSQDNVHRPQLLKRKESRSGFELDPSTYQPNDLPLGQTGPQAKLYGLYNGLRSQQQSCTNFSWGKTTQPDV